jgi:hypothetical protein
MAIAGVLEVQMMANMARLSKDMNEAKGMVGGAMSSISKSVDTAKSALASLGVGIGVGALSLMVKNAIGAAAALDDLSESTGASVAELSKLSQQARISGVDMGTVEGALVRLGKSLNGTDEESKKATRALGALGLKAEELRNMDTGKALKVVADAMNNFGDSSGKTALAMDLLGKSGAQALPFLKDLANDAELSASVTAEQAAQAEELGKVLRRLVNDFENLKNAMILGALPGLFDWIDANKEAVRIGGSVSEMLRLFVFNLEAMTTERPGEQIRRLTADIAKLGEEVQKPWWKQGAMTFFFGEQDIKDKQKQIEFLKYLQRQEALALGGADSRGEAQRFGLAGSVKPRLDYEAGESAASKAAAAKRAAELARIEKEREQHLARLTKIDNDHWVRVIEEQFKREADEAMRLNEAAIRKQEQTVRDLESLRISLLTEEEVEQEAYVRRLSALIEANQAGIVLDGEMKAIREQMEEQHQKRMFDIIMRGSDRARKWEVMNAQQRTDAVLSELVNMTAGTAQQSKAMFEINKVASVANAVMKGYESVVNSYAFGSKIGGPFLGAAMAAVAAAATFAQVNAIRSTTFGSGGAPSIAGSGTGAPQVSIAQPGESPMNAQQQTPRDVRIQLIGSRNLFTRNEIEEILNGINEATADGFPSRFKLETA